MSLSGDIADQAAVREAEFLSDALAAQRRRSASNQPIATECEDCGAVIPEARRLAVPGTQLCVHCQDIAEQRERSHAV